MSELYFYIQKYGFTFSLEFISDFCVMFDLKEKSV